MSQFITAAALLLNTAAATQPNIIHIIADDLGWNNVGWVRM